MIKILLAGALALVPSNPQQAPLPTFVANPYIRMIRCTLTDEKGKVHRISGTGFKLADGRFVSANHVTRNDRCQLDGKPIHVIYAEEIGDLSVFTVENDIKGGLEIDCGGYRDHAWFHAQGYAEGLPVIRSVPAMYSETMTWLGSDRGWSVLIYNKFIPGQSGGPVIGSDGKVVGIVNAFNEVFPISFSRELRRTILCSRS